MGDKQLEDFIAIYPSINEDDIQARITAKYEFAELASTPNDPVPAEGDFYNHQKLLQRYAKVWDRAMIISETGTGKSYLAGALGEVFRIARLKENRGIKKVLILVKGETQMTDMVNTLLWKSTNKHYITKGLEKSKNSRAIKNNATRALGQWYEIVTYGVFNGRISRMTAEQIRAVFSDYLIIIDEIHNFRVEGAQYDLEDLLSDPVSEIPAHEIKEELFDYEASEDERAASRATGKVKAEKKKEIYKNIFRLTHIPNRIKVFGMTASVVIKSPNEFAQIMNLVLPEDRLFDFDADIDNMEIDEMAHHVRGMISYVRALDTGIKLVKQGLRYIRDLTVTEGTTETSFTSDLTLYPVYMSDHQTASYLVARMIAFEAIDSFKQTDTGASSWVYPDGSWGKTGFERNYEPIENGWWRPKNGSNLTQYYNPQFRTFKGATIENEYHIGILSAKDAAIYDIIMKTKGVVVIYDHIIHGGVLDLAIALSNMGFERFHRTDSVFKSRKREKDEEVSFRNDFRPKLRFAIFHENKSVIPHILDVAGSYLNRKGEYIKVFIITDASKEGISISNMVTYIQRSGVWNSSDEYQAQSRGIRSMSHDDLIEDQILELMKENPSLTRNEAKSRAQIQIKGYFLNAVPTILVPDENEIEDDDIIQKSIYAAPMDIKEIVSEFKSEKEEKESESDKDKNESDSEIAEQDYYEGYINYSYISRRMEHIWEDLKIPQLLRLEHDFMFEVDPSDTDSIDYFYGQTDLHMYQKAQLKHISYKRLLRKLKRLALDCHIHYARNVRPNDVDYSSECDFELCQYKCYNHPKPVQIDYSTYDVYYLDEVIKILSNYITEYFSRNCIGTINDIVRVLRDQIDRDIRLEYSGSEINDTLENIILQKIDHLAREENISIAVTNMIVEKKPVRDRYGFKSYIREDDGIYYTIREYPTSETVDDRSLSYYSSTLLCKHFTSISEAYMINVRSEIKNIWDKISQVDVTDDEIIDITDIITKYGVEYQIAFLEKAIIESQNGNNNELVNSILYMYEKIFYKMPEPRGQINKKANELRKKSLQKAENVIKGKPIRYKGKIKEMDEDNELYKITGEEIYFHSMLCHVPEKSSYRKIPRIINVDCDLRVYKPSENIGWRYANPIETIVYKEIVRNDIEYLLDQYDNQEIYGMITLDNTLSIVDKTIKEKDNSKTKSKKGKKEENEKDKCTILKRKNKKKAPRGRVCVSYSPTQLRRFLSLLEIKTFPESWDGTIEHNQAMKEWFFKEMKLNKQQYKEMKLMDFDKVLFYYLWFKNGRSFQEIEEMWEIDQGLPVEISEEELDDILVNGMILEIKKDTAGNIKDIDQWDYERIEFYYAWTYHKDSKEEMSDLIAEKMEQKGILLRWRQI